MSSIYLGNDNALRLIGLRREEDFGFVEDATVTARLLDDIGGTEVSGMTFPLALAHVDQTSSTFGGEASDPTVVKSTSNLDLTVTVGGTNALLLSAGMIIEIFHEGTMGPSPEHWKVARDASGATGSDVLIHLMPLVDDPDTAPSEIEAIKGEIPMVSAGVYRGVLEDTLSLVAKTYYYAEVTVDAATEGLTGLFWEKVKALDRL